MRYNQCFRMQDLFLKNPQLVSVFPQFEKMPLQNVYSFAAVERQVLEYLKNALGGSVAGKSELKVQGKRRSVIQKVRGLQGAIESFFNSMPSIVKNLRRNTKLYTPYASLKQVENITDVNKKMEAMNIVLDNINYNPDFNSANVIPSASPLPYQKRQENWKKRVGYREKTK